MAITSEDFPSAKVDLREMPGNRVALVFDCADAAARKELFLKLRTQLRTGQFDLSLRVERI